MMELNPLKMPLLKHL
jgi:hypothetical protein